LFVSLFLLFNNPILSNRSCQACCSLLAVFFKSRPSTRGCATQAGMTQAITYHVEFPA